MKETKSEYILPIHKKFVTREVRKPTFTYKGKRYSSHTGKARNSIDFPIPEGTPILASRNGIIIRIKSDSKVGGMNPKFKDKANFITIVHPDGTFADYLHIQHKGVLVKIGDYIKRGQKIGYSGNTGWSTAPHLHFMVWKFTNGMDWDSVKIKFKK